MFGSSAVVGSVAAAGIGHWLRSTAEPRRDSRPRATVQPMPASAPASGAGLGRYRCARNRPLVPFGPRLDRAGSLYDMESRNSGDLYALRRRAVLPTPRASVTFQFPLRR